MSVPDGTFVSDPTCLLLLIGSASASAAPSARSHLPSVRSANPSSPLLTYRSSFRTFFQQSTSTLQTCRSNTRSILSTTATPIRPCRFGSGANASVAPSLLSAGSLFLSTSAPLRLISISRSLTGRFLPSTGAFHVLRLSGNVLPFDCMRDPRFALLDSSTSPVFVSVSYRRRLLDGPLCVHNTLILPVVFWLARTSAFCAGAAVIATASVLPSSGISAIALVLTGYSG